MHLLAYDTIIFDLDFTIWDGCRPKFWAKLLRPPYRLQGYRLYGADDEYIQLQDDVGGMLWILYLNNKNIGFASIGALEDVDFDQQPSIQALKLFGLYPYFNHQKTLVYKTTRKAVCLIPKGLTVYIDDDDVQLADVKATHGSVIDTLDRKSFTNWRRML